MNACNGNDKLYDTTHYACGESKAELISVLNTIRVAHLKRRLSLAFRGEFGPTTVIIGTFDSVHYDAIMFHLILVYH